MTANDFSPEALRAALSSAEKGVRNARAAWFIMGALGGTAMAILLRYLDWGDMTHRVIVLTAVAVVLHINFALYNIRLRQDAIDARMLRALELLHERLGQRDRGLGG